MKRSLLTALVFLTFLTALSHAVTPLAANGRLKLGGTYGTQIVNEINQTVQLRGMSSHGLQWFDNGDGYNADCMTEGSMDALVNDWGIDVIRPAMYLQENGYLDGRSWVKDSLEQIVDWAEERGIYAIIDWHILNPGNPNYNKSAALTFFKEMAQKYASKKHVLYEIANEPNQGQTAYDNCGWTDACMQTEWNNTIKPYAEEVIDTIRKYDPEGLILVGTPGWSGNPFTAANNPITGSRAHNVMYSFHFYAGGTGHHVNYSKVGHILDDIPVFVTEFGTSAPDGNNNYSPGVVNNWMDVFDGSDASNNPSGVKVSWVNWSYADKNETSAALNPGACDNQQWNNTTTAGTFIKGLINTPDLSLIHI